MSKYINIISMSFIFGIGVACASDIKDEFEEVIGQRVIAISEFFPSHFSAEHIKQLAKSQKAPSDLSYANFTLDKESEAKFQTAIPYTIQVITGSWSKFAANIRKIEGSERQIDPTKLVATYQFTSPYTAYNNVQFDVALEGKTYDIFESVLGENDFIKLENQLVSNSCFYYISTTDEQFVRESKCLHRFNCNMSKLLLICAQLNGEDIYSLDESRRQMKGQELFQSFLTEKNYVLNSDNLLTMDQYVDCMMTLQKRILACCGVCVDDVLSKLGEEEVFQFEEKKLFVKARVGV